MPATAIAPPIHQIEYSAGGTSAATSSSTNPTSAMPSPSTTSDRPNRFTSRPPINELTAEVSANGMLTMPANTGAYPSPCCRNSVVRRNTAGIAAKYAVASRSPLRYEPSRNSAKWMAGDLPAAS